MINISAFLVTWLTLKVIFAVDIWMFTRFLHYRSGEYGTFTMPIPPFLLKATKIIYGDNLIMALIYHPVHHRWPKIAAWNLPKMNKHLNTIGNKKVIVE